jgi:hypothetical protein
VLSLIVRIDELAQDINLEDIASCECYATYLVQSKYQFTISSKPLCKEQSSYFYRVFYRERLEESTVIRSEEPYMSL